jgi:hypothetical protein
LLAKSIKYTLIIQKCEPSNPKRRSVMKRLLLLLGAFMLALSPCRADIPHLINYQGMLTDNAGNPVNEPRDLTFTIYDAPTNGTALWTETHTIVPIENGLFNVILGGATAPVPDSVFDHPERFLGIRVGTDPELVPRIQLTSVGYAYRAMISGTAETDGDWTVSGDDMYSAVSGNVGIGTASPDKILDVNGHIGLRPGILANAGIWLKTQAGTDEWYMGKTNIGGTNQIGFYKDDWRMVVDSSGNVGIGTTDPLEKLHVSDGYIRVDPWNGLRLDHQNGEYSIIYTPGDDLHFTSFSSGGMRFSTSTTPGGTSTARLFIKNNGDLGIGTIYPSVKVDVIGNQIRLAESDTVGAKDIRLRTDGAEVDLDVNNADLFIKSNGGNTILQAFGGNVGIGTNPPTQKLDVNGTARLRGISDASEELTEVVVDANGVLYKKLSVSSIRYKKNIREIEIDTEDILKLQTVRFEWKESGKEDVGLIAEDVENAVPDLVIYDDQGRPNGVRYDKLALYLLETVKELKAENEELKEKMEELKSIIE